MAATDASRWLVREHADAGATFGTGHRDRRGKVRRVQSCAEAKTGSINYAKRAAGPDDNGSTHLARAAVMNIAEIQAELAQLDAQIAAQPKNYAEALQLRQARRRREMLQAELMRMERLADLPEALRERLRQYFSVFDDATFQRLLEMDESALQRLLPRKG